MNDHANILRIKAVNNALEELAESVVFIGGATVSLYKDRPSSETRVTDDVDIVVEVASYAAYAEIENELRKKGFVNDIDSKVICRYQVADITVDVLPTEENALGFRNRWYPEGFRNAIDYSIAENEVVKIFNSIYFLASKLDAFNDRGNMDGRTSTDFEDIVYLLNNRRAIWNELEAVSGDVKHYLKGEFQKLVSHKYIHEWISAHLDFNEQDRVAIIITGLKKVIEA